MVARKAAGFTESSCGPGLELCQDCLGEHIADGHDNVDVVRADVQGVQVPSSVSAMGSDRPVNDGSAGIVQFDWTVAELSLLTPRAARAVRQKRRERHVVFVVHRSARVAMEPRAIAGPGQEVADRIGRRRKVRTGPRRGKVAESEPRAQATGREGYTPTCIVPRAVTPRLRLGL